MATLKAVIRKGRTNIKGECIIEILLVQHGKTAYIKTDFYIEPGLMKKDGKVNKKHPNFEYLNNELGRKIVEYERKILKLGDAATYLSAKDIKDFLTQKNVEQIDFFEYSRRRIQFLKDNGKKTFKIYEDSIKQIKEYVGRDYLPFNEITVQFLQGFETYSREKKNRKVNTISVYLRSMNTIFKSAMDELNRDGFDAVIKYDPFKKFKIKSEQTKKRNLDIDVIRKIRDYNPENELQSVARDMFMLIFYLIGINTIDLFWCTGIENGRIIYTRAKTASKNAREYSIKVEPEAMLIIEKYKGEKYLLQFSDFNLKEREGEAKFKFHWKGKELERSNRANWQYADEKAFRVMINDSLKEIALKLGIEDPITTYWARHSWATIAWNECEIPEGIISVCLGHDETANQTTQVYIEKRLKIVDEANRKVLDKLLKKSIEVNEALKE